VPDPDLIAQAADQLRRMQISEALKLINEAELANHDPDECCAGRWTCHMLRGDFELAWRESDAISKRGKPDPHRFWDGWSLEDKRVLIRCLHGLGDTLQFIRYAPLLRKQTRALTIEAQPTLKPLLEQVNLADEVITWGEAEPPWDAQVEIIELPRIFRTTLETIPRNVPYIEVDGTPPLELTRASSHFRVGLVWASSVYNPARSIALDQLAPLFSVPGIRFYSLQIGDEHQELRPWLGHVTDLHDYVLTPLATARTLKGLDLVISVDTMMAHLSGAMARTVWTLLPFECDWRWMLDREDSPWYPTMRLFRQTRPDDWGSVIERVRTELMTLAASRCDVNDRLMTELVRGA
jgi:hypothetical protein